MVLVDLGLKLLCNPLPGKLSDLTASYRADISAVSVCGERNSTNVCWLLRNGTSGWKNGDVPIRHIQSDVIDESVEENTHHHHACSHRHGASMIVVGDEIYLVGGKR